LTATYNDYVSHEILDQVDRSTPSTSFVLDKYARNSSLALKGVISSTATAKEEAEGNQHIRNPADSLCAELVDDEVQDYIPVHVSAEGASEPSAVIATAGGKRARRNISAEEVISGARGVFERSRGISSNIEADERDIYPDGTASMGVKEFPSTFQEVR
jgi:hypothetical protein